MNEKILAIDPGTTESGFVLFDSNAPLASAVLDLGVLSNEELRAHLRVTDRWPSANRLVLEDIQSFGMPVGVEVFRTVEWVGRFIEAWYPDPYDRVFRKEVKLHLCQSPRAKDPNVRRVLIDMFGPGKSTAVGTKRHPGPLHGIRSHAWSALAVAVTYTQRRNSVPSSI